MKADQWFRAYTRVIDNPKFQLMDPELFRQNFNFWCLAKLNGGVLPPASEIAWRLRRPVERVEADITALLASPLSLLERRGKSIGPTDWMAWQTKKPVSTERVERHRNTKRNTDETPFETPAETSSETPNVTGNETEKRREEKRVSPTPFKSDVEAWVEKLCDTHPAPCDPRYPTTFCEDNWLRLGEDPIKFTVFMGSVYQGLNEHCRYWEIDGNRFAKSLDSWLLGGGWKKAPPRIVEKTNGNHADLPLYDHAAEAAKLARIARERAEDGL